MSKVDRYDAQHTIANFLNILMDLGLVKDGYIWNEIYSFVDRYAL